MLIGNYFKKIKPEFKKHYFSGINFNSKLCKKNNIFFAIKGNQIDGINLLKMQYQKEQKQLFMIKNLKDLKMEYYI